MYSDIFDLDQLNAGGGGGNAGARNARDGSDTNSPLVSFKAGKMNLTYNTELSKYECIADEARGQVRLVWKEAGLQWQWYDRRAKLVTDTVRLNNYPESTFERVDVPGKAHEQDRIYVWTKNAEQAEYEMYWMQDADESKDDEVVASVNQYLSDPQSAAPVGSSSGSGSGSGGTGSGAMDTEGADSASPGGSGGSGGGGGANNAQVDALSSILENLGMPQSTAERLAASGAAASGTGTGTAANTPGATAAAAGNRTLTLADLQGAMAGIQSSTAGASASAGASAPALSEIVTPAAVSSLLEHDDVANRLMALLPEEQRNTSSLQENLRSPQVQQTLRSLTSALLPDDDGNMDGFYSVLANFSLDPADGQAAMVANNPIQAFLDCVLAKVEKDKAAAEMEESKEE